MSGKFELLSEGKETWGPIWGWILSFCTWIASRVRNLLRSKNSKSSDRRQVTINDNLTIIGDVNITNITIGAPPYSELQDYDDHDVKRVIHEELNRLTSKGRKPVLPPKNHSKKRTRPHA
jgi:hypothetical protein